ncbi:MAG: bifunctional glycosyltransferase/class I SAM-dependent methyltransferase [Treponema sp.]|nr:bifunctional glycosyltransferase/class I SAM-dependent methyltransferase [Treponema sp.]
MNVLVVQCRLSSSRLPQKALFKLDGKELLAWTLDAMHKVECDEYVVACDYDSLEELKPVAQKCGWKIIAGSRDDVLERFCNVAEQTGADIIMRGTADNPLLFYEAAQDLLKEYSQNYCNEYDYMTYTGLPHGSGVEIFKVSSLLKAKELTDLPYDHEHVGPALYNHPENFKSLFKKADDKYYFPSFRTTVDTYADYLKAKDIVHKLKDSGLNPPFAVNDITCALQNNLSLQKRILFVPCTKTGCGTGHLRRCFNLAKQTDGCIFIEDNLSVDIPDDFDREKIISKPVLKGEYDLIVTDLFRMDEAEYKKWSCLGTVAALDEGSDFYKKADYSIDVIPSLKKRILNQTLAGGIERPGNIRAQRTSKKEINKVLVCFGGEDPAGLTGIVCNSLLSFGFDITAVVKNPAGIDASCVKIMEQIPDLKNSLADYDLVVTHYGFTAFEALMANTNVILCGTTAYHHKLGIKHGFYSLSKKHLSKKYFIKAFASKKDFFAQDFADRYFADSTNLCEKILKVACGKTYLCPVCRNADNKNDVVAARTVQRTFRRCKNDSMLYIAYSTDSDSVVYQKSYFAEEYKKQYGKTYLEDFESIKKAGLLRAKNITKLNSCKTEEKSILDVGCAYGPFLSAAKDYSWKPYGCDIAEDAVAHVNNNLGFKAIVASFLDFDSKKEFGLEQFDAVTMWYVIEHIRDLKKVLADVNKKLKCGGIFAFSTPSAGGVSAKKNTQSFFENSPKDHFTLWEPANLDKILKLSGFKVKKVVITGHHPERFPVCKKHPENNFFRKLCMVHSKLCGLGETFEVYCVKTKDL